MTFIKTIDCFQDMLVHSDCFQTALELPVDEKHMEQGKNFDVSDTVPDKPEHKKFSENENEKIPNDNDAENNVGRSCYMKGPPQTEKDFQSMLHCAAKGNALGLFISGAAEDSCVSHMIIHRSLETVTEDIEERSKKESQIKDQRIRRHSQEKTLLRQTKDTTEDQKTDQNNGVLTQRNVDHNGCKNGY